MHRLSSLALASVFVVQVLAASNPVTGSFTYIGCYTDDPTNRTLQNQVDAGNTTVESCVAACQERSPYRFAGVEFGTQCFCDSDIHGSGLSGNGGCNMLCEGDPNELCGGPNRLDMYLIRTD